jgi:hypothetical protein
LERGETNDARKGDFTPANVPYYEFSHKRGTGPRKPKQISPDSPFIQKHGTIRCEKKNE